MGTLSCQAEIGVWVKAKGRFAGKGKRSGPPAAGGIEPVTFF